MRQTMVWLLLSILAGSALPAQAQQNECQSGQGLLLADILQNDANLTIGATWVENSGANLALANPFTNVTLFGATDSVGLEYYEKYFRFPLVLGPQGIGSANGTGAQDISALFYLAVVGYYDDEAALIKAGSINTLWGMGNDYDAVIYFSAGEKGELLVQGMGDTPAGRVLYKRTACNGVLYVLDSLITPADESDQVNPTGEMELTGTRVALSQTLACRDSLLDSAERAGVLAHLENIVTAADAEFILDALDDPDLSITVMLPSDDVTDAFLFAWANEVSEGNATLAAQVIAENRLYAALPGVFCDTQLVAAGRWNSLLGEMLGMDLPLKFDIGKSMFDQDPANADTLLISGEMDDPSELPTGFKAAHLVYSEVPANSKIKVCNSELWILDSMPLMRPEHSPVLQGGGINSLNEAVSRLKNVSMPPRHLTCNPAPYSSALKNTGGMGVKDVAQQERSSESSSNLKLGLGVGVGVAIIAGGIIGFVLFWRRRRHVAQLDKNYDDTGKTVCDSGDDVESGDITGRSTTSSPTRDDVMPAETLKPESGGSSIYDDLLHSPDECIIAPASRVQISRHPDGTDWVLGKGSWGVVRRGLKDGVQPVAVKALPLAGQDNKKAQAHFARETQLLKRLRDPSVVQFMGIIFDGEGIMMVTELMEGGDLREAINADYDGKLRWYGAGRDIALDVTRALVYLHSQRFVHRDVKSRNILLDRTGRAKLADFGLGRILESSSAFSFSDGITGTFPFAAPELLLGQRCTEKVDIFSFGIVLWEIITGERAVRGHMRPLHAPEDCPAAVIDIVQACTNIDFQARPSARELYELLSTGSHNHHDISVIESASPARKVKVPNPAASLQASTQASSSGARVEIAPNLVNPFATNNKRSE